MSGSIGNASVELVRIMEICRDIEIWCAELYKFYADLFKDNPEISDLWKKTANEEENHANQFTLAIKLRRQGAIDSVIMDPFKAETALNVIKSIYEGVRHTKPSLEDALRSAIKLEHKLSEFHSVAVTSFSDESFKKTFMAMMKADDYHIDKLQTAYEKLLSTNHNKPLVS